MIKITGAKALQRAARDVAALPEASERAGYRAVNAVLGRIETQSRRDIAADINLPQSYIREQSTVSKAGPGKPQAVLAYRVRPVRLARFSVRQLSMVAPRAKGDSSRGITQGRKQAGVSVKVSKRGARKTIRGAFLMRQRAGRNAGSEFGIFIRSSDAGNLRAAERQGFESGDYGFGGKSDVDQLYGPSPDQLFRRWKRERSPDVKRLLAEAYASQLRFELRGSRK